MKTFQINDKNQTLEMIRLTMYIGEMVKSGKIYDVEVKEHREKRSNDANAYFWQLLGKLSAKTHIAKTEIYKGYIKEIGGNSDVVCLTEKAAKSVCKGWEKNGLGWLTDIIPSKIAGCKNVVLYYGSSTYDTSQMSRLIDFCVFDCKEYGIETLTPMELDRLKRDWDKDEKHIAG